MPLAAMPSAPQICFVPYTAAQKIVLGGAQNRIYDFVLDLERLLMEEIDLNNFWICAGGDVERIFAGAWLLVHGDRIAAELRHAKHTQYNRTEGKTYLRLWFLEEDRSIVKLRLCPKFTVRVALQSQHEPADLYFIVNGHGVLLPKSQNEPAIDETLYNRPFVGRNQFNGIMSTVRWSPAFVVQPPAQHPPQAQPPQRSRPSLVQSQKRKMGGQPPPPQPQASLPHAAHTESYSAEKHLAQILEARNPVQQQQATSTTNLYDPALVNPFGSDDDE